MRAQGEGNKNHTLKIKVGTPNKVPRKGKTMTKKANCEIKFIEAKIIVSKKFYKAAGVLDSPEYKELMRIRALHPDFTIELREIQKKAGKKTYRNLTYENMEKFIAAKETDPKMKAMRLAQFQTTKDLSVAQAGRYAYVKNWFLSLYGDEYKDESDQESEVA